MFSLPALPFIRVELTHLARLSLNLSFSWELSQALIWNNHSSLWASSLTSVSPSVRGINYTVSKWLSSEAVRSLRAGIVFPFSLYLRNTVPFLARNRSSVNAWYIGKKWLDTWNIKGINVIWVESNKDMQSSMWNSSFLPNTTWLNSDSFFLSRATWILMGIFLQGCWVYKMTELYLPWTWGCPLLRSFQQSLGVKLWHCGLKASGETLGEKPSWVRNTLSSGPWVLWT